MERVEALELMSVSFDADEATLKRAYHAMALKHHPDKNPGDDQAHVRFQRVADIYDCLTESDEDKAKRRAKERAEERERAKKQKARGCDETREGGRGG